MARKSLLVATVLAAGLAMVGCSKPSAAEQKIALDDANQAKIEVFDRNAKLATALDTIYLNSTNVRANALADVAGYAAGDISAEIAERDSGYAP